VRYFLAHLIEIGARSLAEFSREIYSFIEIARERSIRQAAEKLNISSSALSRQMRLLEQDLGVRLLIRRVTGVELTEAGRLLLQQTERWLDDQNRLRAELSGAGRNAGRVFRIGAMECFADNLVPELFAYLRRNDRIDRVEARFAGTENLLQDLQDGMLDLVIAFNVHHSQNVRVVSEKACRIGLICSPGIYAPDEPEVAISTCLDWPICLPGRQLSLHTRLYAEILKQRKRPDIRAESNSVQFIRNLAIRGECVSFLTWFDVRNEVLAGTIRFLPLTDKRLTERVCLSVSGTRPFGKEAADIAWQAMRILERFAGDGQGP